MNWVGSAEGTAGNDELDTLVWFETVDTTLRHEVGGLLCTTQDLEENWDSRRFEGNTIYVEEEGGKVKHDVQINVDVSTARGGSSRHSRKNERVEGCLDKRCRAGRRVCRIHCRVLRWGPCIAENSQVVVVSEIPSRRQSANPIVVNGLVGSNDNRVTLTDEDLNRIDGKGLDVRAFNFDYGHLVPVNREIEARIAGNGNQAESVA